ncbi:MAG TPA: hypothetical protein VK550_30020 [Polyangiaceae bacterium]|nr:hypothetical protein [Polyangiaceae bacterium]
MCRLTLAALVSIWFYGATAALAAGAVRASSVVLVRPANSPPVMVETLGRLKGELISAGFEASIVDGAPGEAADSRAGLERLATERGADAVVAIVGDLSPNSVEVWVIDKVTGKSVVRRMTFEPAAAQTSKTLALRAIELLRASFLEIDLAAHNRQNESLAAPPPAVVHFVEMERLARHPERWGVEVGGAAVMSLDRVGPAVLPIVRLDGSLRPWFVARATLAGLGTRPTVESQAGSAHVEQAYGLLGGSFRFRAGALVHPFAELSAGVLHTSVEGRAAAPNQSGAADQWSFLCDAGLGTLLRLPDRFYLSLAAHVQLAEPYPAVRFLGKVVATSARPNVLLIFTVGAWL